MEVSHFLRVNRESCDTGRPQEASQSSDPIMYEKGNHTGWIDSPSQMPVMGIKERRSTNLYEVAC